MNPIDDQLKRLFQAASQARSESILRPPYGLETQVLAAWRSTRLGEWVWDMALLVRGVIFASLIMGLSLLPLMSKSTNPFSEDLQLADTTVPFDNAP
jgi:hypothetical protein